MKNRNSKEEVNIPDVVNKERASRSTKFLRDVIKTRLEPGYDSFTCQTKDLSALL